MTSAPSSQATTELCRAVVGWHAQLRDRLCGIIEAIEFNLPVAPGSEPLPAARFHRKTWERPPTGMPANAPDSPGSGGGTIALLQNGRIFEKAGINISNVWGIIPQQSRSEVKGSQDNNGRFWASGLSLVIHPRNPHVPAIHMNTRMMITSQAWFGGVLDLNPALAEYPKELVDTFHNALRSTCGRHNPNYYHRFAAQCRDYFFLPHRQRERGVGGIFFDHLNSGDLQADFALIRDLGRCFAHIYPLLVTRTALSPFDAQDRRAQNRWRGLYAEFNLIYDRGTRFGLQTAANPDAVLVSLPPIACW